MYIEPGGALARVGGRIGRVTFSKTGRTLRYCGRRFQSLNGAGFKENYIDLESREGYWISGPRRDGNDALYPMEVAVDVDVREEYWSHIRKRPDLKDIASFKSPGKYTGRGNYKRRSASLGTGVL